MNRKPGRPKGEPRVRMNALVLPDTLKRMDSLVEKDNPKKSSRGKLVDLKFKKP